MCIYMCIHTSFAALYMYYYTYEITTIYECGLERVLMNNICRCGGVKAHVEADTCL